MKSIIITILSIIAVSTSMFGKTRNMTSNQYNLAHNKVDSSLVGTWEKSWNLEQKAKDEFCQFNANGTFLSYKKENGKYIITGRGKWMVEKGVICITHGNEKNVAVKYESTGSRLTFGEGVSYSKPSAAYANK
ncbi:MAG: hypothetical protein U0X41_11425 [Chitinophagales bacterium]